MARHQPPRTTWLRATLRHRRGAGTVGVGTVGVGTVGHRLALAGAVGALALGALGGCATPSDDAATTSSGPATTPTSGSASAAPSPSGTPSASVPADQPTNGTNAITSPRPGETVAGPTVTVTGTATAVEGNLSWEVVTAGSTTPLASGYTTGGANGEVGPFTFPATIPPGTVTLSVWEPDLEDSGPGTPRHNLTTVTFTVS